MNIGIRFTQQQIYPKLFHFCVQKVKQKFHDIPYFINPQFIMKIKKNFREGVLGAINL